MNSDTPSRRPARGGLDGLGLVDDHGGHQAAVRLAGPRERGLDHEGEAEFGAGIGQFREAGDQDRSWYGDVELAREFQRAVLVAGDLQRAIRREREHAAEVGQGLAVGRYRRDVAVSRRQHHARVMSPDEIDHRVPVGHGIFAVVRHLHGKVTVPGAERGDRLAPPVLRVALGDRHPETGTAEAPRAGQALLMGGVEYEHVVPVGRARLAAGG
jgi:hypothetical protein